MAFFIEHGYSFAISLVPYNLNSQAWAKSSELIHARSQRKWIWLFTQWHIFCHQSGSIIMANIPQGRHIWKLAWCLGASALPLPYYERKCNSTDVELGRDCSQMFCQVLITLLSCAQGHNLRGLRFLRTSCLEPGLLILGNSCRVNFCQYQGWLVKLERYQHRSVNLYMINLTTFILIRKWILRQLHTLKCCFHLGAQECKLLSTRPCFGCLPLTDLNASNEDLLKHSQMSVHFNTASMGKSWVLGSCSTQCKHIKYGNISNIHPRSYSKPSPLFYGDSPDLLAVYTLPATGGSWILCWSNVMFDPCS